MIAENKKGRTTSERRGSEQPKTIFTNSKSQEKNKYENIWVFGYIIQRFEWGKAI